MFSNRWQKGLCFFYRLIFWCEVDLGQRFCFFLGPVDRTDQGSLAAT